MKIHMDMFYFETHYPKDLWLILGINLAETLTKKVSVRLNPMTILKKTGLAIAAATLSAALSTSAHATYYYTYNLDNMPKPNVTERKNNGQWQRITRGKLNRNHRSLGMRNANSASEFSGSYFTNRGGTLSNGGIDLSGLLNELGGENIEMTDLNVELGGPALNTDEEETIIAVATDTEGGSVPVPGTAFLLLAAAGAFAASRRKR